METTCHCIPLWGKIHYAFVSKEENMATQNRKKLNEWEFYQSCSFAQAVVHINNILQIVFYQEMSFQLIFFFFFAAVLYKKKTKTKQNKHLSVFVHKDPTEMRNLFLNNTTRT